MNVVNQNRLARRVNRIIIGKHKTRDAVDAIPGVVKSVIKINETIRRKLRINSDAEQPLLAVGAKPGIEIDCGVGEQAAVLINAELSGLRRNKQSPARRESKRGRQADVRDEFVCKIVRQSRNFGDRKFQS